MSDQTQLCRRFFDEVCNQRKLGAAEDLFAAGHAYHDPSSPGIGPGPGGMKDLIGAYHAAFRDARWDINAVSEAGDTVVTRWTGRGTHTGSLMGIAPTGRTVAVDGIWLHRVAGGRIVESWNCWDALGLLRQIGAVPALAA